MDAALTSAKQSAYETQRQLQRVRARFVRLQTLAIRDQPRLLLSVLLPPLGVYYKLGFAPEVVTSLLLTLLFFIPGVLHALYVLTSD